MIMAHRLDDGRLVRAPQSGVSEFDTRQGFESLCALARSRLASRVTADIDATRPPPVVWLLGHVAILAAAKSWQSIYLILQLRGAFGDQRETLATCAPGLIIGFCLLMYARAGLGIFRRGARPYRDGGDSAGHLVGALAWGTGHGPEP